MANEKLEAGIVTLGKIELVSILPQYLKSFGVESAADLFASSNIESSQGS